MRTVEFQYMSAGGVSYSANPITGDRTEVVISANYGHNSTVTGGDVEPDQFTVDRDSMEIKDRHLGQKQYVHITITATASVTPEATIVGAYERCALAEKHRQEYCLSDEEIREVTRLTLRISELFGYPVDVEWMFADDGKLYVLQSSPITTI